MKYTIVARSCDPNVCGASQARPGCSHLHCRSRWVSDITYVSQFTVVNDPGRQSSIIDEEHTGIQIFRSNHCEFARQTRPLLKFSSMMLTAKRHACHANQPPGVMITRRKLQQAMANMRGVDYAVSLQYSTCTTECRCCVVLSGKGTCRPHLCLRVIDQKIPPPTKKHA